MSQIAFAPNVFTWPAERPQLIGEPLRRLWRRHVPGAGVLSSLRRARGWRSVSCPPAARCGLDDPGLPPEGAVRRRRDRGDFVPFGVGLVQLGDDVRVEGRLTENDPEKLEFGMDVELTIVPFTTDDDGNELVTVRLQPV